MDNLAQKFKVIGEENRMRILCLLFHSKKLCVSRIAENLNISIASASHHLKALEKASVLESVREGKEICYVVINNKTMNDIRKVICSNIK